MRYNTYTLCKVVGSILKQKILSKNKKVVKMFSRLSNENLQFRKSNDVLSSKRMNTYKHNREHNLIHLFPFDSIL